ncbi:hypothetical protein V5799_002752 [Amblyomma americanum]|uniref:Uncharacterized protein n=1 Tax=Amblyomma americanum TaxID=6943 RepID=A0AAQ4DAX5_AMBAM
MASQIVSFIFSTFLVRGKTGNLELIPMCWSLGLLPAQRPGCPVLRVDHKKIQLEYANKKCTLFFSDAFRILTDLPWGPPVATAR